MTDNEKIYCWEGRPNGKESALAYWREEHGPPDPADDDTLHHWFADNERKDMLEWWNDINPGEPVPRETARLVHRPAHMGTAREPFTGAWKDKAPVGASWRLPALKQPQRARYSGIAHIGRYHGSQPHWRRASSEFRLSAPPQLPPSKSTSEVKKGFQGNGSDLGLTAALGRLKFSVGRRSEA